METMYVHKWDGTVKLVVTQDEPLVAKCADDLAAIDSGTIYFFADAGEMMQWHCDAHRVTTYGDCPKCDDEMIAGLS